MRNWFRFLALFAALAMTLMLSGAAFAEITPDSNYFDEDGNMILPLVDE